MPPKKPKKKAKPSTKALVASAHSPFENINTLDAYESPTNPRSGKHSGPAFEDLRASIADKGILVPVIVRRDKKRYEVIAGSRRLAVAVQLNLKTIPARIVEADDQLAREIQIVENLHRADIHPVDEAEAYRELIETAGLDVPSAALRVGKTEDYLRNRLRLLGLSKPSRDAFRKGGFTDSHAVLLSRLTPEQQKESIEWIHEEDWDGNGRISPVSELKDHIDEEYREPLKNQPWLDDKTLADAIGPCTDCPKNRQTLFGEETREGECVVLECYRKKMERVIAYRLEQDPKILQVSSYYGVQAGRKNVLSKSAYTPLSTKKKAQCDSAEKAVVMDGDSEGQLIDVCADPKCKIHKSNRSEYARSPAEEKKQKEKQRKEREEEKKRKEKIDADITKAVEKISWPPTEETIDALLELACRQGIYNATIEVGKRRKWKPVEGEYRDKDWGKTLEEEAKKLDSHGKFCLVLEILASGNYSEESLRILKKTT